MKKYVSNLVLLLFSGAVFFSCAEDKETDLTPFYNEMFDRWMAKYHPEAEKLEDGYAGLYVEWFDQNPSAAELRDGYWMRLDYTGQDQHGDVIVTRREDIAQQLGFYVKTARTHYVPEIIQYSPLTMTGTYPYGQIMALGMMNEGDSLRIYMPPGFGYTTSSIYGSTSGYSFKKKDYGYSADLYVPQNAGLIFDMRLVEIIKDIRVYEREQVERFAADTLGITDMADSIAQGVYMKKLLVNEEGDSVKSNSSIKTFYIGRYLDGFVFATNIDSVAKANGITETITGEPYEVDLTTTPGSTNSKRAVSGFETALLNMQSGEYARVVFTSANGYGDTGYEQPETGNVLTLPYAPLEYEIWIESVETPEDEDDEDEDEDEEES